MNRPASQLFLSPEHLSSQDLQAMLEKQFSSLADLRRPVRLEWFDTFDWRIFNKSLLLRRRGQEIELIDCRHPQPISSVKFPGRLRFIGDLPDGTLHKAIAPIVEMRALLSTGNGWLQTTIMRILNDNQKTIAYVHLEAVSPTRQSAPNAPYWIYLHPLRGYEREFNTVALFLKSIGCRAGKASDFHIVFNTDGRKPGAYGTRPDLELVPEMHAAAGVMALFRSLRAIIADNEAGVIADTDTEFLHDFRVAIRRTRTALDQMKQIFSDPVATKWNERFREIGRMSNHLRDLDVNLLERQEQIELTPAAFRADILPLFDYVALVRKKELRKLKRGLRSEYYLKAMADWDDLLGKPLKKADAGIYADVPVIELASHRIYKLFRRVSRICRRIDQKTPDDEIHDLRIICKKLRYLMEFFRNLYPVAEVSGLIKQVKQLQDVLGRFQDLSVQIEQLSGFCELAHFRRSDNQRTLIAIGVLIGVLSPEKQNVRKSLTAALRQFDTSRNRAMFDALFKRERKEWELQKQ